MLCITYWPLWVDCMPNDLRNSNSPPQHKDCGSFDCFRGGMTLNCVRPRYRATGRYRGRFSPSCTSMPTHLPLADWTSDLGEKYLNSFNGQLLHVYEQMRSKHGDARTSSCQVQNTAQMLPFPVRWLWGPRQKLTLGNDGPYLYRCRLSGTVWCSST